ncbi:hypothetical protein QR680_010898 [Steinernema hermaphroditum]|uniref:Uncharacterized protein n=1 Tax=Steinernema hermaphroditum TaxID=289476 RepID=A0AA39IQH2_9BILA|nr:hypothetical protein QR680_010898 [Steinernema hermaphroditum]
MAKLITRASVLGELRKSDVSDAGFGQGATKLMRLASNFSVMAAPISTSTGLLSYEYFHNRADSLKFNQPADRKN